MKALISGPEDTPYEHGLYLCDIYLPETYPNTPPDMTIKTIGKGSLGLIQTCTAQDTFAFQS